MASNSFVAADEVPALTYDFTAYKGESGVIPEPTDTQITTFRRSVKAALAPVMDLAKRAKGMSEDDVQAMVIAGGDDTISDELWQQIIDAVGVLCGGSPSADQINALPGRVKTAFAGWITGIFLQPKALTPDTNS